MSEDDQEIHDMTRALMRRLREERLAQGLSQREVGDRCGVSKQQIALWERTRPGKVAKLDTLSLLARALGYQLRVTLERMTQEPQEAQDERP